MKKKTKIMRIASVVTAVIGFCGLVLAGAADIWHIPQLGELGELAQTIVSAACMVFGINAGKNIYYKED